MLDVYQNIGSDLIPGPSGDLLPVSGIVQGQQRILRRLMTNPGDYLWHTDYGAGLPTFIGEPASAAQIQGVVINQMLLEEAVSQNPLPSCIVSYYPDGTFFVSINYTDSETSTLQLLEFDITQ